MSSKIMVIRHGEKQEDFPADPNIGRDGQPDPSSLNSQGWRRARALVDFFEDPESPGIAKPSMIFATDPATDSKRPKQTVTLLAKSLWPDAVQRALHFNKAIGLDAIGELIDKAKQAEGVVLIAWEHKRIPTIAAALNPIPPAPGHWPGSRFDVVWIFDLHGGRWVFSQTPENLLPDDKDKPIKDNP